MTLSVNRINDDLKEEQGEGKPQYKEDAGVVIVEERI
jgi:hypothetical protein